MNMKTDYRYYVVGEDNLDLILRGESVRKLAYTDFFSHKSMSKKKTGVLVAHDEGSKAPWRPLAIVCHEENVRRMCGRYAHLRSDLSPISVWCHLISPTFHNTIHKINHYPSFRGTVAAWSGLCVAERLLLTGKTQRSIPISACLGTATFAIARSTGLWPELAVPKIIERFSATNALCGNESPDQRKQERIASVQNSLLPLWLCLSDLANGGKRSTEDDLTPLIRALSELMLARERSLDNEGQWFSSPLLDVVPEAKVFENITEQTPEERLGLFDQLVWLLKHTRSSETPRRDALAMVAGYLATVAAGGEASLSLVHGFADECPELLGWSYLLGGIGERITWTSGFDGLGRLVARELTRPFRIDESPNCDFAFDEAEVLSDVELQQPLIHLKIKQSKTLSVGIFPGVNVVVPVNDHTTLDTPQFTREETQERAKPTKFNENALAILADEIWPHLQHRVADEARHHASQKSTYTRRQSGQKGKREVHSDLVSMPEKK